MTKPMDHSELRSQLINIGWLIDKNAYLKEPNEAEWYAWIPTPKELDWPDCETNHKPPALILEPFQFKVGNHDYRVAEISLTGEANGIWHQLRSYSVSFNDVVGQLPFIMESLGAAWFAVSAVARRTKEQANDSE